MSKAYSATMAYMTDVEEDLESWGQTNGRFPANQEELDGFALRLQIYQRTSPFSYEAFSQPQKFRLIYIENASGPSFNMSEVDGPAIVFCAFDRTLQHGWITATAIDGIESSVVRYIGKTSRPGIHIDVDIER